MTKDMDGMISASPGFSDLKLWYFDKFLGPVFFQPYAIEVASRIRENGNIRAVLELACGTGNTTLPVRRSISEAAMMIASDINSQTISIARQKIKDDNIDWAIIDGERIPLLDKSVDVVVCAFGYMFMQDKLKAFSEAFRVLRPGGTLIFTTWDKLEHNPIQHIFRKVLSHYFKDALDEGHNKAFSFNDEVEIGNLLLDAGFSLMSIEKVVKNVTLTNTREVAIGMAYGSNFYDEIVKRSPQLLNEIIQIAEKRIAALFVNTPQDAPLKALICMAKKIDFENPCFGD